MGYAIPMKTSTRNLLKTMATEKGMTYENLLLFLIKENKELKVKNKGQEIQIDSLQKTINDAFLNISSNGDLKNG